MLFFFEIYIGLYGNPPPWFGELELCFPSVLRLFCLLDFVAESGVGGAISNDCNICHPTECAFFIFISLHSGMEDSRFKNRRQF